MSLTRLSIIPAPGHLDLIEAWAGHMVFSEQAEDRAQKLVAVQFFLLAPYVAIESARVLIDGEHPLVSLVGIALAVGSVVFMPMLAVAKERLAIQLGSSATKGEVGRACSAPISPAPSSWAWSAMLSSGPGGSIRRSDC